MPRAHLPVFHRLPELPLHITRPGEDPLIHEQLPLEPYGGVLRWIPLAGVMGRLVLTGEALGEVPVVELMDLVRHPPIVEPVDPRTPLRRGVR